MTLNAFGGGKGSPPKEEEEEEEEARRKKEGAKRNKTRLTKNRKIAKGKVEKEEI